MVDEVTNAFYRAPDSQLDSSPIPHGSLCGIGGAVTRKDPLAGGKRALADCRDFTLKSFAAGHLRFFMSREKEALASTCAAVTCAQLRRVAAAATVKFRK